MNGLRHFLALFVVVTVLFLAILAGDKCLSDHNFFSCAMMTTGCGIIPSFVMICVTGIVTGIKVTMIAGIAIFLCGLVVFIELWPNDPKHNIS
jgi:hypothetical protein